MSDDKDPCAERGHDRCYDPHVITTHPPQRRWICRRCMERGTEAAGPPPPEEPCEYYRLLGELKGGRL